MLYGTIDSSNRWIVAKWAWRGPARPGAGRCVPLDAGISYVDSWADAPPIVVVAKSAKLRFRLRRKLRPLPCSSSPHRAGRGGGPFWSCQKRNGPCTVQKKRPLLVATLHICAKLLYGSRRIGACSELGWPSGTLWPSARSILPSRGGGYGGRRGARTHLTCFSFTVSRCGAPSISATSVPLVPPSARSALPARGTPHP